MKTRWIVGIDEAGRGALAGPVAVGLFAIKEGSDFSWIKGVKDSKQLSPQKREEWFKKLKTHIKGSNEFKWKVVQMSNKDIDRIGISKCIFKAIEKLLKDFPEDTKVLLDGSLKAPLRFLDQTTIIKGDVTEPLISMASIAAKVTRDQYMTRAGKKYPYLFEVHKGYGTKLHKECIKKNGLSDLHRIYFCH